MLVFPQRLKKLSLCLVAWNKYDAVIYGVSVLTLTQLSLFLVRSSKHASENPLAEESGKVALEMLRELYLNPKHGLCHHFNASFEGSGRNQVVLKAISPLRTMIYPSHAQLAIDVLNISHDEARYEFMYVSTLS